ncbi:MAG: accessory gene regulator B family protein [Saccharofermentans sp.]|nr:accessory gene regulator B family protein [Saccharofermentans sp.]
MDIRFAEKISDHISEYMYQNQIVDVDELQVCKYNLQVFFERTVTFLSLGVLSLLIGHLLDIAVFTITLMALRVFSGGFHCKTFLGCFILTIVSGLLSVPLSSLVVGSEMLLGLFSLVPMVLIGAVNHPDMNWSCSEFSAAKRWSRAISIIVFVITIALTMTEVTNTYSAYTAVGSAFAAASLLIAKTIELWNRFLAP